MRSTSTTRRQAAVPSMVSMLPAASQQKSSGRSAGKALFSLPAGFPMLQEPEHVCAWP